MPEVVESGQVAKLVCDFCEKELRLDSKEFVNMQSLWSRGQQGYVMPYGGVSGVWGGKVKISCTDELCKAKLLVWAHS